MVRKPPALGYLRPKEALDVPMRYSYPGNVRELENIVERAIILEKSEAIPLKYRDDARHIAIGVHHDIDFIVSSHYNQMVDIQVKRLINSVNLMQGYGPVEIVSLEEVAGYGELEI